MVGHGSVRQGWVCQGKVRHGFLDFVMRGFKKRHLSCGAVGRGMARHGRVGCGQAWCGSVGCGGVRFGLLTWRL